MNAMTGWIGVDFDGTLAADWQPVPRMVERVRFWLSQGKDVRIFTARAERLEDVQRIETWCESHIGKVLRVTNVKDFDCLEIWDNRAVRVITNTGLTENEYKKHKLAPLDARVRTRKL